MGYLGSATATLITLWAMMAAVALAMRLTPGCGTSPSKVPSIGDRP